MNYDDNQAVSAPPDSSPAESTNRLIHDAVVGWLRNQHGAAIEAIDHDASLFEFGIDSLGFAEISREIEDRTGKRLVADEVFELETINELAAYIDSHQPCSPMDTAIAPSSP